MRQAKPETAKAHGIEPGLSQTTASVDPIPSDSQVGCRTRVKDP